MTEGNHVPLPSTYEGLVKLRPLRPIRNADDLSDASWFVLRMNNIEKPTKDQNDYLGVLHALMQEFESTQPPIDTSGVTMIDMLKDLMDCRDMSPSDLGRVLGDRSMGQKVLSGQHGLSKANILKLARHFHVSPDLFLNLTPIGKPSSKGKPAPRPMNARNPARSSTRKPAKKRAAAKG